MLVFHGEYWWFWCCHFVKIMKHARFPRKYWWFYDFKNQEKQQRVPGCSSIIILREYYSTTTTTTTTINPLGVGATYLTHPHTYAWQLPPGGILSPLLLWYPSPRHPALFRQETTFTPTFSDSTDYDVFCPLPNTKFLSPIPLTLRRKLAFSYHEYATVIQQVPGKLIGRLDILIRTFFHIDLHAGARPRAQRISETSSVLL